MMSRRTNSRAPARHVRLMGPALLAAVIAALLALSGCGARASTTPPSTAGTPSPSGTTTSSSPWERLPGLSVNGAQPLLAPSDPRVAYQIGVGGPGNPPSQVVFRRTDDAGATWHDLTSPVPAGLQQQGLYAQGFVSPLDPQTLFVVMVGEMPRSSCPDATEPDRSNPTPTPEVGCILHYRSTDGGAHWQALTLPVSYGLGGDMPSMASLEGGVRAQGTRLFAYANLRCICDGSYIPPGRLLRSDDGGATWAVADGALAAVGQGIADFAPAPQGDTIFAATAPTDPHAYANGASPAQQLWRSDDAGDHWTQIGTAPNSGIGWMHATRAADGSLWLYVGTGTNFNAPSGTQLSADGGHTWTPAPAQGLPTGLQRPVTLLAPTWRADGTVVFPAQTAHAYAFYAWKAGDAAWQEIAPPLATVQVYSETLAPSGTGGHEVLYVTAASAGNDGVFRYSLP